MNPYGSMNRLKARLVAKGCAQTYGVDYIDTFFLVAKLSSIRIIISLASKHHWPLFQLDVKNDFLHGDLQKEVYGATTWFCFSWEKMDSVSFKEIML